MVVLRPFLLLNWFKTREAFAADAVEGFNLKARVTTRIAYGFRSYDHAETALYHASETYPSPIGSPTEFRS
jgi:hypothetical protein